MGDVDVTPVDHALGVLESGLDHLVRAVEQGGLDHYDDGRLIEFAQTFERVRNQMSLVDHEVVAAGGAQRLAERRTQPDLARVLVSALRISSAEAHRRVRAAEAVGPRRSRTGKSLPVRRPVLAAAQRAGEVSPEQVHLIQRALEQVDRPGFDPVDIDAGEALLTAQAAIFEPKLLGQLADQVVAAINPDGTLPEDRLNFDRRHFWMRPTSDGAWVGGVPADRGAGREAVRGAASAGPAPDRPHPWCAEGDGVGSAGTGGVPAGEVEVDGRTFGQRMHDAVEDVCDRMLRSGGLPDSGGTPATVIVTITLDDLVSRLGYGRTSDGTLLSVAQVLELAEQADIIPTVLNRSGAVLSQGRSRRLATAAQTWALVARDGGCSFPGCDRPPELCERHHVVPWSDGGRMDVDNLTLVCRYHHHQFGVGGWTAAINSDGLPEWTPPAWIDRERRPVIHARVQLARLTRQNTAGPPGRSSVTTAA